MSTLKALLTEDMKTAMRGHDKPRLDAIRLMLASIKQQEVDTRKQLDDAAILAVLEKMLKQRRESFRLYSDAGRTDLANQEEFEIKTIQGYMPQALSAEELTLFIQRGIEETGAVTIRDMGKVMNWLKPQVQGRTDMGQLSGLIKARLGG